MKIIEVLFPEFQNVYADQFNIKYFSMCNKNIKVVYTHVSDEPYFVKNNVDMIYIGSMPDSKINASLELLMPYKDKIKKLIDDNVLFLITGNAIELFGKEINYDGVINKALNIFNYKAIKSMTTRYVSWYIGEYDGLKIIGHKNQFSYLEDVKEPFIKTINGFGNNSNSDSEGVCFKNFYATYNLGPFLIYNPLFTKLLLRKLKLKDDLFSEKNIIDSYNSRLDKISNMDAYIMGDKG